MGWRWFFAWALPGGGFFFALLAVLSIGVFVAPLAIIVLVVVCRRARRWPESLGSLVGIGLVCIAIAALNWGEPVGGGASDPVPWLVSGMLLVAAGAASYAVASRNGAAPPAASERR